MKLRAFWVGSNHHLNLVLCHWHCLWSLLLECLFGWPGASHRLACLLFHQTIVVFSHPHGEIYFFWIVASKQVSNCAPTKELLFFVDGSLQILFLFVLQIVWISAFPQRPWSRSTVVEVEQCGSSHLPNLTNWQKAHACCTTHYFPPDQSLKPDTQYTVQWSCFQLRLPLQADPVVLKLCHK